MELIGYDTMARRVVAILTKYGYVMTWQRLPGYVNGDLLRDDEVAARLEDSQEAKERLRKALGEIRIGGMAQSKPLRFLEAIMRVLVEQGIAAKKPGKPPRRSR